MVISDHNNFRVLFGKIASVYFIRKNTYILTLEMASPGNQHCASCIGTISFPISRYCVFSVAMQQSKRLSATMLTEVAKYNCRYSLRSASTTFHSTRWKAAKSSSRVLLQLETTNSYASRHHNARHCHPLAVRQSLLRVTLPRVTVFGSVTVYR